MRFVTLLFISSLLVLVSTCVSSEKNSNRKEDFSNLVSLNPPGEQKQEDSNIYIDTVQAITLEEQKALLISGSFPDACTHLKSATDTLTNDTLKITLKAWRETDRMCAQVLTSFSYIYEGIPEEVLNNRSTVTINNSSYPIN